MATLEQLDALIVGNPLLRQRFRAASNATVQASPNTTTDNDLDYVVATFLNQWAAV